MSAKGIVLFNSSFVGSSAGQSSFWNGGRSTLMINAAQYGLGVIAQVQGPSGAWIPICSSLLSDQYFSFDAPPGQYRLISNQGSSLAMVATLTSTPYM